MDTMLDLIIGDALPWLVGVGAFLLSVVWAWFSGGRSNEAKHTGQRLKGMKKAQEMSKEIDNADKDVVIDINTRP